MPRLAGPDPALPDVITMAAACAAGLTPDQVRQRVRSGRWLQVRRGVYLAADTLAQAPDEFARARVVHRAQALGVAAAHAGAVVAGESAAIIHGLPLAHRTPKDVRLLVPPTHWTGTRGGVRFSAAVAPAQFAVSIDGVLVTDVSRTLIEIGRAGALVSALVPGDAALRRGLVTADALRSVLNDCRGLPGIGRAEWAIEQMNGMRESPLESASWAYFIRHDVELPEMQVAVYDDGGRLVARVDFLWRRARLVGECDGRMKYGAAESFYAEKRREDALRADGFGMVRWGLSDLRTPDLARHIAVLLR